MFSGSIQPTKNWSFNVNASYDFIAKRIANMTIGISRDLHCWSLTANAIPFGPYRSYSISIGVKSSLLHDVKWDKHGYSSANSLVARSTPPIAHPPPPLSKEEAGRWLFAGWVRSG